MGSPGTRRTGTCCRRCSWPISTPAGCAHWPATATRRVTALRRHPSRLRILILSVRQYLEVSIECPVSLCCSPVPRRQRQPVPGRSCRHERVVDRAPRQCQVRRACLEAGPPPDVAELNCSGFGGPMGVPDRVSNTKLTYSNPPRISPWHAGFRVMPLTGSSDRLSTVSAAHQSRASQRRPWNCFTQPGGWNRRSVKAVPGSIRNALTSA
jgi:hypothetical protein